MSYYQDRNVEDFAIGSSDRPRTGSKGAIFNEPNEFEALADGINNLKVLDPITFGVDKEKTNAARMRKIEEKTKERKTVKGVQYIRNITKDNEGYVILAFDRLR